MKITIDDIAVHVKILNKGSTLATATTVIDEVIEIHGWTISTSKFVHRTLSDKIQIQPPRNRINAIYWKKVVFIKNPEFWRLLEEKIYDEYFRIKTTLGENYKLKLQDKTEETNHKVT